MKNQNGITLIALIITIIVMLILVAVTVTTAVQSGLFDKAGKATQDWKTREGEEANIDTQIKSNVNNQEYTGIDDIVEAYNTNKSNP